MQHGPAQEPPQNIEMSLREHLLAAGSAGQAPSPYPQQSVPPPPGSDQQQQHPYPTAESAGQHHDHQHLDPNVTGGQLSYAMSGDSAAEDGASSEIRKGKRELSTSKRAAQNRAAQRAFRQRKEGYIKKLEEQVKEFENMEQNYKALLGENNQLREYILNLQTRLLDNQSDYPPAPPHTNLPSGGAPSSTGNPADSPYGASDRRDLHSRPPSTVTAREDPPRHDGMSQLHAAAAAQASDNRHSASPYTLGAEYSNKRSRYDDAGPGSVEVKPS